MSISQINLFHRQGVETERTLGRINAIEHLKMEYGTKETETEEATNEGQPDYDDPDWFSKMFDNPVQNITEVKTQI